MKFFQILKETNFTNKCNSFNWALNNTMRCRRCSNYKLNVKVVTCQQSKVKRIILYFCSTQRIKWNSDTSACCSTLRNTKRSSRCLRKYLETPMNYNIILYGLKIFFIHTLCCMVIVIMILLIITYHGKFLHL